MSKFIFVEDIFLEFYSHLLFSTVSIAVTELQAIESFYQVCLKNSAVTEKQARYMKAILKKYSVEMANQGLDYSNDLSVAKFKHPFRIIDETRRAYIEQVGDEPMVFLKFPYVFKETFDQEFKVEETQIRTVWDSEKQARTFPVYSVNLIRLHDFLKNQGFIIEESLLKAVSDSEIAWENQQHIIPHTEILNDSVVIKNASNQSIEWFEEIRSGNIDRDLILAKTAGFPFTGECANENVFTKIARSNANKFWLPNLAQFFEIFMTIETKCCIMIDRTQDKNQWLTRFIEQAEVSNFPRNEIKVCFREKDKDSEFNKWVKDQNLGGKTDSGSIYIFEHRPSKWIFKDASSIGMIATTLINPSTNPITRDWLASHPLCFYLTDIKPTSKGNLEIVQL